MRNDVAPADDQDSLYILPLSHIPLETRGLRKARLIKTPRLEGVVELFSGSNTGSGHVAPSGLYSMFDFGEEPHPDVEMIRKLSVLPSYDVYSLRRQLRRMGIEVDDVAALQLSAERADELSKYMQVFTRPLIHAVYGHRDMGELNHAKIVDLFRDPDISIARQNIMNLSAKLKTNVEDIPSFLESHGDVYLSLSYYQYCYDQTLPLLDEFNDSVDEILKDNHLKFNHAVCKACTRIKMALDAARSDISFVLEMFRARTGDMWEKISEKSFRAMEKMVHEYQISIGAALCAITVKMNAWKKSFPYEGTGSLAKRADFIVSEVGPGLETLPGISYSDA